jgi:hypothetical protein
MSKRKSTADLLLAVLEVEGYRLPQRMSETERNGIPVLF